MRQTPILSPIAIALAPLFFGSSLSAQTLDYEHHDEVIIFTANKMPTLAQKSGARTDLVDETMIEERQWRTVEEALSHLPAVTLNRNGLNGPASLFIRGAGTQNTLVLLDGVPLGDPMGTGRTVDYTLLGNLAHIERVEVLKGAQSTLYGSSGMGGVVQLFTKMGKKPNTTLDLEAGTESTYRATIATSGMNDRLTYAFAGALENSHGIDATLPSENRPVNDADRDGYRNRSFYGKINYLLTEQFDLDLMLHHTNRYYQYDNEWNNTAYDNYGRNRQTTARVALNGHFLEGRWDSSLSYGINQLTRNNYSGGIDWMSGEEEQYHYPFKGRTELFTWHNILNPNSQFATIFGASYQKERGEGEAFDHKTDTKSLYIDQHLQLGDNLLATIGARHDKHSTFGSRTTTRTTIRYNINEQIALKGSYGTGFNAPNAYQLYDAFAGNERLKAEKSRGFDFGVVAKVSPTITFEVTYFEQKYRDMIDYFDLGNWQGEYRNLDEAKMRGVELSGNFALTQQLDIGLGYSYLDAKEKKSGGSAERMIRRPRHQVSANINYRPNERLTLNGELLHYSARLESMDRELKAFTLLNLGVSYRVNEQLSLRAKVENVGNERYHYAAGYREPERRAFLGMKIEF